MEFGEYKDPHKPSRRDERPPSFAEQQEREVELREESEVWVNKDKTIAEGPLTREEEEARILSLSNQIGGKGELRAMTLRPNCDNLTEVVEELNKNETYTGPSPGNFGTLYPEGTIAFVKKDGRVAAVGPGYYRLWNPLAEWCGTMALGAGFQYSRVGPCHVLRVPNGMYALCWQGTRPVIITAEGGGYYAINSEFFRFERFVPITQPSIDHGTYHIVRVPKGQCACVNEAGKPYLLPFGVHIFDSLTFTFSKFSGLDEEEIKHGTLTRFIVKSGHLGLAWEEKTEPLFFNEPGVYFVDSAMFDYSGNVDIAEKEIHLGSRKIITVHEGEVGISHDSGVLKVLQPGRHVIDKPGWLFDEFLSTQQQGLALAREDQTDGMMECETRELVSVGVQAYVFYSINDPRLAVVKIGSRKNIERLINETATAVITTIIRSTGLSEISQGGHKETQVQTHEQKEEGRNRKAKGGDLEKEDSFEPNLPFFDRVKDDFLDRLQKSFRRDYGISMLNIRIGDFKVIERQISNSISKHALITAETQANLANLEGRRQIDLVNKDSDARIERMAADVEAHKLLTTNKARAQAIRDKAHAEAQAKKVAAEARARAVTIKAEAAEAEAGAKRKEAEAQAHTVQTIGEAEAKAIRLRGEAEAKRAEKLGATELGREEALAAINADMVVGAMKGLEKVVYMPTELQRNPFAFFQGDNAAFPMTNQGLVGHK